MLRLVFCFFFSSRRRHTIYWRDWSSDVCSSDLSDGMADAVEKISPAVVRVNGRRRRSGSGVVYAPEMVLTASHVLEREEDLPVVDHGGKKLPARVLGRDPPTDLAVLRVEGLDAEPAKVAEGNPRIGQLALAVGRSGRSDGPRASLGVVSSAGGPLKTWRGGRLERYVQTDATPYPGISGGALADARGNVLGILTTGLSRGAALAIPADLAWRVAGTLSERGSLKRGYLGILSQPVRLPDAQGAGLTQRGGLLVVGVDRKSTRLNSSHANISYAVFCLKKKKTKARSQTTTTCKALTPRYSSAAKLS